MDELDSLTRNLRLDLLELDVEQAELVAGDAPPLAKSAEAVTAGALLISLLPTVIPKVIEFLQTWVGRAEDRKLRIKSQVGERMIELEYSPKTLTNAELKSLIETLTAVTAEKPAAGENPAAGVQPPAADPPGPDVKPATGS
jgi:hypothetical protein